MTEYRRIKGRDTWHWCKNCPNYPIRFFDFEHIEFKNMKPTSGKLCKKCQLKEKRFDCRTY